ncbi:hypothetical protein F5I97DRAFT_1939563 [Phlebopus sp. FC_14]|nr:hypothetical protein F5I97DRAFT_1939563 [Phlebopus sp. FC_14]
MSPARKVPDSSPVPAFLSQCDPAAEVYVTHIDSTDVMRRKRHFLKVLAMNISYTFLLVRRAYGALSLYGVRFLLGKVVPVLAAPAPSLNKALFGNLTLDLFLFLIFGPLVYEFVTGIAMLRYLYGFPQEEIVFRKLTQATIADVLSKSQEKRDTHLQELLQLAIDPEEMKEFPLGLPWEQWAYDYNAMASACKMEKEGKISAKTWELSIWMKMKDGWTVVEPGKSVNPLYQVGMMEKLKNRLQAMGKIQVFYQMMEVIQLKTLTNDGNPLPITEEVDTIIAEIFKNNGIDLEKLTLALAEEPPKPASKHSKKTD